MAKTVNKQAKQFAIDIANIAVERNCTDVTVMDLRGKSPATDYFVIATNTSGMQGRSVVDEMCQLGKGCGFLRFGLAGYEQGRWILVDFVDVVVHIFDSEYRDYYDLEVLWGDAEKIAIDTKPRGRTSDETDH